MEMDEKWTNNNESKIEKWKKKHDNYKMKEILFDSQCHAHWRRLNHTSRYSRCVPWWEWFPGPLRVHAQPGHNLPGSWTSWTVIRHCLIRWTERCSNQSPPLPTSDWPCSAALRQWCTLSCRPAVLLRTPRTTARNDTTFCNDGTVPSGQVCVLYARPRELSPKVG